jgi:hypothetical protein
VGSAPSRVTISAVASSLSSSMTQTWTPGKDVSSRFTVASMTASSSRAGTKMCQSRAAGSPGMSRLRCRNGKTMVAT